MKKTNAKQAQEELTMILLYLSRFDVINIMMMKNFIMLGKDMILMLSINQMTMILLIKEHDLQEQKVSIFPKKEKNMLEN